jgi:hypothetical protein
MTGLTQIEDDRDGKHTRPIRSWWGTVALMWQTAHSKLWDTKC